MTNKIENLTNRGRGRPAGAENKTSSMLKRAMILATEHAGHEVAMRKEVDRIEKLMREAQDEGRELQPGETEVRPELVENSGLITYLADLALTSPSSFATLLSKVITVQQADEERGVDVDVMGPKEIIIDVGYIEHGPYKVIPFKAAADA